MLTGEKVFENYGENKNKVAYFGISKNADITELYRDAARKYGTPNPPKAPYIVKSGGGEKLINECGDYSYKPTIKIISPNGNLTFIDWYAQPQGYSYEKIKDILKNDFGIEPGGTAIQGLQTQKHADQSVFVRQATPHYCRLFSDDINRMQLKVYSLKGQCVFEKKIVLNKGMTTVSLDRSLVQGSYLMVFQKGDMKTTQRVFVNTQ